MLRKYTMISIKVNEMVRSMGAIDDIMKMAKENNCTVATAMVVAAGIFSHETALFLWDLTDRTPNVYAMTFPSTYNLTKPKQEKIHCIQCKAEWYKFGVNEVKTPGGNTVRVYNQERTLCDILRPNSSADIQIVSESFKRYAARKSKNIPLLSQYAKVFKVEKKLRSKGRERYRMPEYSRILIEEYCMSHQKTKKSAFLWDMVQKSYDIAYEPEDCEILYLEQLISRERNQELKTALQDLDDFMCGC